MKITKSVYYYWLKFLPYNYDLIIQRTTVAVMFLGFVCCNARNNAGITATPFSLSKDNIELQFATNHLGT